MLEYGAERPSDVHRVARVMRSRKWLIMATTLLFAIVAYGISAAQTPTYAATAELVISPQDGRGIFDSDAGVYRDPSRAIQTEIQVILGRAVQDAVEQEIGDPAAIDVQAVGLTDAVEITAESNDPDLASATANAYAKAFIDYRRLQDLEMLTAAEEEIQSKVAALQTQIDELDQSISAVVGFDLAGLVARRDALIAQQAGFSQRLDQILVDASLQGDSAELVYPAPVPTDPVSPRPMRNSLFAGMAGLFFGIALAFVLDRFDDSIKTREDLERLIAGVPVLASVPAVSGATGSDATPAPVLVSPGSPASEAYRSLRTAMKFESLHRPLSTIQVTSPMAAEGKSTTVANLATTLADAGERVIVVGCDLRRPRIHEFFALENRAGFTSAILDQANPMDLSQPVPGNPNVVLLSSGPPPPNPSELLSSSAAGNILTQLSGSGDVVVIDSPPVLPVTDAAILAQHVDATLLVVAAGQTTSSQVVEAVDRLRAVDAPLVGLVLNGVTESSPYSVEYSYGESQPPGGRRWFSKLSR